MSNNDPQPTDDIAGNTAQAAHPQDASHSRAMTPEPSLSPSIRPSVLRPAVLRPGVKFLFSHTAHFIALGAGSGLLPKAPGTFGTLWAWGAFALMQLVLSEAQIGGIIAVSLLVGWWACTLTAGHLRVLDPGAIVWDEVVAFWMILLVIAPAGFMAQLIAFALFRFFDAVKPGPVAWADELFHGFGWKGGFGIMLDDLVAAACTLLVIAMWRF
jgi:phosphatidylglycerophosphatase A